VQREGVGHEVLQDRRKAWKDVGKGKMSVGGKRKEGKGVRVRRIKASGEGGKRQSGESKEEAGGRLILIWKKKKKRPLPMGPRFAGTTLIRIL